MAGDITIKKQARDRRERSKGKKLSRTKKSRASASYMALVSVYPIHPIRSERDLDEAIAVVDTLLIRRKPLDCHEQDYLDILSHEIERYETIAYPMPDVSDAALLRHLIDAKGVSLSEVAAETRIAISTLSSVLNEKRKLNLRHVRPLAAYFGVEAGVFLE